MRIATANFFDTTIATLQARQQRLQTAQEQLTSGKRIAQASDDPTGAARAERALAGIDRADASQRALDSSRNAMGLAESALGDATGLLQQVRESLVAAGNASYSDAERQGLATTLQGLRDQLLAVANRSDGSSGYIFSGQGASSPPFLDQASGVSFIGISGTLQTGNIDNFQLTIDGRQTFEQARSGNGSFVTDANANSVTGKPAQGWINPGSVTNPAALTGQNYRIDISGAAPAQTYQVTNTTTNTAVTNGTFTPGQAISFDGLSVTVSGAPVSGDNFSITPAANNLKLFDVLDRVIGQLKTPLRGPSEIAQTNSNGLRDIDAVMGNLQNVRSQVGGVLNNLDGSESRLSASKLYNTKEKSAAEDLDMVQAISSFQSQQTGYSAALQSYAMVQKMSLFQYLNG